MTPPDAETPAGQPEFDRYADDYDRLVSDAIAWTGAATDVLQRSKIEDAHEVLRHISPRSGDRVRVLDFGAGVGHAIPHWRACCPDIALTCADVSPASLAAASQRYPDGASFQVLPSAGPLPFETAHFDFAFTSCVFHHIPAADHPRVLAELHRVLRPGGALMIYEHNPWNPVTRHIVRHCPFDEDAVLIRAGDMVHRMAAAGFRGMRTRFRGVSPWQGRLTRRLEAMVESLPLGAQYFVIGVA
jgi:SAM-dependent methyltransferase